MTSKRGPTVAAAAPLSTVSDSRSGPIQFARLKKKSFLPEKDNICISSRGEREKDRERERGEGGGEKENERANASF